MKKRVVIVGGGINGLTAANYLQKQNFDVKILEKNNNIGGACVKLRIQLLLTKSL